ncbi:MAG: S8 family peptidase [Pseudomonadota bacterium]
MNMPDRRASDEDISTRLDKTMLAMPLIDAMKAAKKAMGEEAGQKQTFEVIIDLNLLFAQGNGIDSARAKAIKLIKKVCKEVDSEVKGPFIDLDKSRYVYQHLFATLTGNQICSLIRRCDGSLRGEQARPIYKIWVDDDVKPFLGESVRTIKADAALVSYAASGEGSCWAVIDSGIDGQHPHFQKHGNLKLDKPLHHADFSGGKSRILPRSAVPEDDNGHGTHVAGIIAGEQDGEVNVVTRHRDEAGDQTYESWTQNGIRGVAPQCKLVSLKVLDDAGHGKVSNLIAALGYVNHVNNHGRWRVIHGVNMSVGYEFDAEWFACGQSPLCVEVDRLVRTGVPVVVAAGNTGSGYVSSQAMGAFKAGLDLTINDPGNAERAITVGATHRQHPHTYGVSYFSSKGPTGDGRLKPDLVAPGERIISCAAGREKAAILNKEGVTSCDYREESGTSMAAPHVSGAIAAFLSIRKEFIGEPDKVKEVFLSSCTDLGRDKYFQGHGLLDLMRAIQSI